MYKKISISLLLFCMVLFGFIVPARAQGLLDYGGHTWFFIPCTAMATWNLVYYIPTDEKTPVFALMYSTAKQPQNDDDPHHLIIGAGLAGLVAPTTIPCLVYAGVTVITIGVGFPVVY